MFLTVEIKMYLGVRSIQMVEVLFLKSAKF